MDASEIKALTFDVFGTVVDWRGPIIREGQKLSREKGFEVDWEGFVDGWRAGYQPAMDRVRTGELPWTNLDALNRTILDGLIDEFGITGLDEDERDHLNRAWHRLEAWPDAVAGLGRLRTRFVIATLSNGNVALLTNMAKHARLPWDCILSAELARRYKPDPAAYLTAVELLGLRPEQVMMTAAHQADLRAAQALGMKAAFVPRPEEFGPAHDVDTTPDPSFDVVATDFEDLARQLGV